MPLWMTILPVKNENKFSWMSVEEPARSFLDCRKRVWHGIFFEQAAELGCRIVPSISPDRVSSACGYNALHSNVSRIV